MGRKILVIGQSPLPPELTDQSGQRLSAPSIRAWHFARALHEAGHEVALIGVVNGSRQPPTVESLEIEPGLTLWQLSESAITGPEAALSRLVAEFEPAVVVAASVWPSYLAALYLPPDLPLWADLFGSPLAEGQAKAVVTGDDDVIAPFARFEATVLGRADLVSAVSSQQEYATVGAMATHGRLNRATDGYRLVYTVPATLDPQVLPPASEPALRGKFVPPDAFVVLWSGGFNTWTDVDTLFAGLEGAMKSCPRLHFVATGGALPPHDSQTYPHFQELIAGSPYRDRFSLLGWLPYEGLHNYYLESDLGIVTDRWSYEGVLGSRTRLLDWLLYGLPAVVTVTAQLTADLVEAGLAFSFPHRDGSALTALLTELANAPTRLPEDRQRAHDYVVERFAYGMACRPILDWVAQPRLAPDAGRPRSTFATGSDPVLERQLAAYEAQIEAKNAQIADLERWAGDMETRLKARSGKLFGKF